MSTDKNPRTTASAEKKRDADPPHESVRPYWVPANVQFDKIPKRVQLALQTVLQPAYDELVLAASDPLERSTGTTFVFLVWLELSEQFQIGAEFQRDATLQPPAENRLAAIGNYLRVIGAKQKVAGFLLRLQELNRQLSTPADPTTEDDTLPGVP